MSQLGVGVDVSAVPTEPVGAGTYTVEIVRALAGWDDASVVLYARRDDGARWQEVAPAARCESVAPIGRAGRLLWGERRLGSAIRRGQPIQVLLGPHYTMPASSPVPVVVTVHDLTFVEHPEWHERSKVLLFRRSLAVAARRAAAIICVSQRTADRFIERYSPQASVVVVPHGVDHARFHPVEASPGSDEALLTRIGVSGAFIVHLGTIEPRKDVATLLAAFERLAPNEPELRLVLAGRLGWGCSEFDASIAASPVANRVLRLGYVDAEVVPALLRQAAAVAYPSLDEGFGLPALEALACGAPLVTTRDTVMADLAGEAAVLVAPHDPSALAAGLAGALGDETGMARRQEIGLRIAGTHNWQASAAAHLEVLRGAAAAQ